MFHDADSLFFFDAPCHMPMPLPRADTAELLRIKMADIRYIVMLRAFDAGVFHALR